MQLAAGISARSWECMRYAAINAASRSEISWAVRSGRGLKGLGLRPGPC
jgi:hypothetical protein